MNTRMLKTFRKCLFLSGLLTFACALAEVQESTHYASYAAEPFDGLSLRQSLNRASPVRWQGRVYHAFTRWNVTWQFYWNSGVGGECVITRNRTQLNAQITLPALKTSAVDMAREFETYLAALRTHEQGHLNIARETAHEIDAGMLSLPAMPSCAALEQTANALGYRLLEKGKVREEDYDRETGYGRTQGASLP